MLDTKQRQKIDFKAIAEKAPKEPEPKTLAECLEEAGGQFPFRAKAVLPCGGIAAFPVGTALTFVGTDLNVLYSDGTFGTGDCFVSHPEEGFNSAFTSFKRWVLLGHI